MSRNRRRLRVPVRTAAALAAVASACTVMLVSAAEPAAGAATIVLHGSSQAAYPSESTTSLRLAAPAGVVAGDVLVATLGFGSSSAKIQPTLTAPAGWVLVNKTKKDPLATPAVYQHGFAAGETGYTWTTRTPAGGPPVPA